MREIDVAALAAAGDDTVVIDVREPGEYATGHVPGARLIPMGQVPGRLAEIPRDRRVYVVCASGNRSYSVTSFLVSAGYDAYSVAGGTAAWARSGRAVVRGREQVAG